jgi:hypothetical protein
MTGAALTSRNDDPAGQAVAGSLTQQDPGLAVAADRIATCGNDGTTWAQPARRRKEAGGVANSDALDGAVPGRPPAAPARAVVLISVIQLVAVAMTLRLRPRRSLRAIERNLAASDPSLTKLFAAFTVLAQGEERGRAEKASVQPLRALARRLAAALEFDPADPWRRAK